MGRVKRERQAAALAHNAFQCRKTQIHANEDAFRLSNLNAAWWGRRDSNPHGLLHKFLRLARLPIPPRPHEAKSALLNYSNHWRAMQPD